MQQVPSADRQTHPEITISVQLSETGHQIRSNEPISVQESNDNDTAYHSHDFLEFAYVRAGSAVQYFNNQPVRVSAGDFFMINFGEKHKYSPDGNHPFHVLNLLFKPEFLDPTLKGCRGFQDLVAFSGIGCNYFNLLASPTGVIFHDDNGEVGELVKRMNREYRENQPKRSELLRAYLTELLILTLRKIYNSDSLDCDDRILCPILDYLNQHYGEPITLREIGERMGYTHAYLSALFSQKVGIPFSHYLQNLRIAAACHLLSETEKSVEEIAAECGYRDLKFFRSVFRDRLRLTPSDFRRMSRKKSTI